MICIRMVEVKRSMRLSMIIGLYVGYKEAYCYGVEKGENSVIIVIESEVWYFIRNQQIVKERIE